MIIMILIIEAIISDNISEFVMPTVGGNEILITMILTRANN